MAEEEESKTRSRRGMMMICARNRLFCCRIKITDWGEMKNKRFGSKLEYNMTTDDNYKYCLRSLVV
jgi:hypothetical protein